MLMHATTQNQALVVSGRVFQMNKTVRANSFGNSLSADGEYGPTPARKFNHSEFLDYACQAIMKVLLPAGTSRI